MRTDPDRLRGYRLGEHTGPYGPMLPPEMRWQRVAERLRAFLRKAPGPVIVHPAVFARWVDQGFITPDGHWRRP